MSRTRLLAFLVAASLCARSARGDAPAQPPRYQMRPLVDYNDPDPDRDGLDFARALANAGFANWAIWQFSWLRGSDWTPVTAASLEANLESGFEFDQDELQTNFLGHPYHGGLFFNSARAAGLSFWESAPYAVGSSLLWELFAEVERPSLNDLASTALGGIMLGEITHRLSSELLDDSDSGSSRLWREFGAMAVSPMRGFNRLYTGDAWRAGPAPVRHPVKLEFHLGLDRVRFEEGSLTTSYTPTLLLAAEVEYGDLYPRPGRDTLDAFEFFDLYAGLNLLQSEVSGATVYAEGLLYGFSVDISDDVAKRRDNDVFGFAMTYDFQGANVATYGSAGFGPANYVALRFGPGRKLRIGTGLDFVPVVGATTSLRENELRKYNFSTGFSAWASVLVDLNRHQLGLRTRQYLTRVVDGEEGDEFIGSARGWYELGIFRGLGGGVGATLVHRQGRYESGEIVSGHQIELQAYVVGQY